MTSIGFGDMVPGTYGEKVTALFVMILGASVYGDLFGSFVAIIDQLNEQQIENKVRKDRTQD